MICGVIQARMTSTRLPGKVLSDIGGQPALQLMLSRLQHCRKVDEFVVATTTNATDDPVAALCSSLGVGVFRGDEHDVLARMLGAAEEADADHVIRLTADCPMIDPAIVDSAVELLLAGDCDYASNTFDRTYPDGLDTEVMTIAALRAADSCASEPELREHVTTYINRRRPNLGHGDFKLAALKFTADFSHVRWTVDTPRDLEVVRALVSRLPQDFGWLHALSEATKDPWLLGLPI